MKLRLPVAICVGVFVGFVGACLLGRMSEKTSRFENFVRLHPFLEQESSYFPTASQLVATARAQCPPDNGKVLVVLGGNSVFNGSGQKKKEIWSAVLQQELGDRFHVINFSAPGAGVMDNGGVAFEILARDYPRALLVTNTEPGYYAPGYASSYSYLFWDAYYKDLLIEDADRSAVLKRDVFSKDSQEAQLRYRLNSVLHFNDLWTGIAYRRVSTVWSSWLKERSFSPRRELPDWYDKRKVIVPSEERFQELLAGHIAALRNRKSLDPQRILAGADGKMIQTEESLRAEVDQIANLLPESLRRRAFVVFTPLNPWFLEHLTADERNRLEVSFENGVTLLKNGGFHAVSLLQQGFEPLDFGDTVHLSPAGGNRLAHALAPEIRKLAGEKEAPPRP